MFNQSYEDYIRNILGYPSNTNIYDTNDSMQYTNYLNYDRNEFDDAIELEQYYPEIYNNIYPKIRETCLKNTMPINTTLLDNMVEEIYNSIELIQENRTTGSITKSIRNTTSTMSKTENRDNQIENRQRQNNNFLRDLIRILLLRELTGRPGRPPRPRPPFGPVPRPPFNPQPR